MSGAYSSQRTLQLEKEGMGGCDGKSLCHEVLSQFVHSLILKVLRALVKPN